MISNADSPLPTPGTREAAQPAARGELQQLSQEMPQQLGAMLSTPTSDSESKEQQQNERLAELERQLAEQKQNEQRRVAELEQQLAEQKQNEQRRVAELEQQLAEEKNERRRLAVLESLVLDPARRLVLVSCDGEERLLLLGDGREVAPVTLKTAKA